MSGLFPLALPLLPLLEQLVRICVDLRLEFLRRGLMPDRNVGLHSILIPRYLMLVPCLKIAVMRDELLVRIMHVMLLDIVYFLFFFTFLLFQLESLTLL